MKSFSLHTSEPHLPGCATPHIVHAFSLAVSDSGIAFGDVYLMITYYNHTLEFHRQCRGRIRTPSIGGGGASPVIHQALVALYKLMAKDCRRLFPRGTVPSAFPDFGSPQLPDELPYPPRERHMDDGSGFLRMGVNSQGVITLGMRPIPRGNVYDADDNVTIRILPTTPYRHSYGGLIKVWHAIGSDNRTEGNSIGSHA